MKSTIYSTAKVVDTSERFRCSLNITAWYVKINHNDSPITNSLHATSLLYSIFGAAITSEECSMNDICAAMESFERGDIFHIEQIGSNDQM